MGGTLWTIPRRIAFSVRRPKNSSTTLTHLLNFGVKCSSKVPITGNMTGAGRRGRHDISSRCDWYAGWWRSTDSASRSKPP